MTGVAQHLFHLEGVGVFVFHVEAVRYGVPQGNDSGNPGGLFYGDFGAAKAQGIGLYGIGDGPGVDFDTGTGAIEGLAVEGPNLEKALGASEADPEDGLKYQEYAERRHDQIHQIGCDSPQPFFRCPAHEYSFAIQTR